MTAKYNTRSLQSIEFFDKLSVFTI